MTRRRRHLHFAAIAADDGTFGAPAVLEITVLFEVFVRCVVRDADGRGGGRGSAGTVGSLCVSGGVGTPVTSPAEETAVIKRIILDVIGDGDDG